MADEQICIHTAQGMVCYRNQSVMTAVGVEVYFDIYCTVAQRHAHAGKSKHASTVGRGANVTTEKVNKNTLHAHIDEDSGRAKLELLFRTAREDDEVKAYLAAKHVDVDAWHTITRMHN